MTLSGYSAVIALATLEGALVALPRADALAPLKALRSPAWAALLPGSIVAGTFLPLVMPSMAFGLVVLAGVVTPALAAVAILHVVRGPRTALVLVAAALGVTAALLSGWAGQISATALTALGCLALGTALARLIPCRWFVLGVIAMCLADVALMASGIGHSAAALMASATADVHGPVFSQADIGRVSTDYPDLVLAALLGGFLAGRHRQLLAASLVTAIGAAYGLLLLPLQSLLPATVPIALALLLLEGAANRHALRTRWPSRARTGDPASALRSAG
ncbi:MAG: hypothetical protein JO325_19520 [Solirubrobacterales bacterium]|nr:hypothetical protein [Solirubrobacterales bacterium]